MIAPTTARRTPASATAVYIASTCFIILCAGALLLSGCGDDSPTSPGNGGDDPAEGWTVLFPQPQPNDINAAARSTSGTLLAVGQAGTILRSTDAGATWNIRRGESALIELTDVDIAGSFAVAVGLDGAVLRSTNGGVDWQPADLGVPDAIFLDVDVVDDSAAHIVGIPGRIWSTTDAGVTWTETELGLPETETVSFITRDEGMIGSRFGWLWTHNGGGIWFERDRPIGGVYSRELHMTGPLSAVAVVENPSPAETIIFTTDDTGLTWTERHSQSGPEHCDLSVVDDSVCYAVLYGHIVRSQDAGLTWTELREIERLHDVIVATGEASFSILGETGYCATSDDYGVTLTPRGRTVGDLDNPGAVSDLHFVNESTGFIGFYQDGLLRTDDGGETWTQIIANYNFRDIHFTDENTAVAIMQAYTGSSGPYDLRRTTDGGLTWTTLGTDAYHGIHLLEGGAGLVTGSSGLVLRSADGGMSWDEPIDSPAGGYLRQPFCVNADTLLVLSMGDDLYRSADAGGTWQTLDLGSHMQAVDFNADRSVGLGVGWEHIGSGLIFRTVDGGATWQQSPIDCPSLLAIRFAGALTAWAVGDEGAIMTTVDGGLTWTREECVNGQKLEHLSVLPDGRAWAGGWHGTIVRLE